MCQGITRRTKCAKGGRPPKSRTVVIHVQARAYLINIRTLSKITDLIRLTSDHIKDNPHQQYSLNSPRIAPYYSTIASNIVPISKL